VWTPTAQSPPCRKILSTWLWLWLSIGTPSSVEAIWVFSIVKSEPWSQDHNRTPKIRLLLSRFGINSDLKSHDHTIPTKSTNAAPFVRESECVKQMSCSLASCSKHLLKFVRLSRTRCWCHRLFLEWLIFCLSESFCSLSKCFRLCTKSKGVPVFHHCRSIQNHYEIIQTIL
jgi:hypothetical protein